MAEEVKIDSQLFHDRLGHLISAWKADKRSGDTLFGGIGSIVILVGKSEDAVYHKNNAMHVCFVSSAVARCLVGPYADWFPLVLATWI
jgi:nucleosome binding factor SPN SPT16 subunit